MQRHDLRMNKIATAERSGDCSKTADLHVEFNRQTVALAEFAIKIGYRARLPLL